MFDRSKYFQRNKKCKRKQNDPFKEGVRFDLKKKAQKVHCQTEQQ
jgi:hypothetical protein